MLILIWKKYLKVIFINISSTQKKLIFKTLKVYLVETIESIFSHGGRCKLAVFSYNFQSIKK